MKRLLLLSNSTLPGEPFLGWAEKHIKEFLGDTERKILFFPFAGVTFSFDEYFEVVKERFGEMGYEALGAHLLKDKEKAVENCDAIAVGGGNTFHLVHYLQDGWIELIREKVKEGIPYIGWSAGANVASPTIRTTNDMPIIEPKNFESLDLISFQINPHFTEEQIPNHGGETRPMRIAEFLEINPGIQVFGIPEGGLVQVNGDSMQYKGIGQLSIFEKGKEVMNVSPGSFSY